MKRMQREPEKRDLRPCCITQHAWSCFQRQFAEGRKLLILRGYISEGGQYLSKNRSFLPLYGLWHELAHFHLRLSPPFEQPKTRRKIRWLYFLSLTVSPLFSHLFVNLQKSHRGGNSRPQNFVSSGNNRFLPDLLFSYGFNLPSNYKLGKHLIFV